MVDDSFDFAVVRPLLAADPDRYIHSAIRGGDNGSENRAGAVDGRSCYLGRRERLADGPLSGFADLITLNVNLRQLAQDVVESCDSPALLSHIYREVQALSVLDPTCGSGAFLFAALNILEPLYEAALERMDAFVLDRPAGHDDKLGEFRRVVEEMRSHPNRDFFVLKSIVVNNLYGVDIMEEAVEICKLRLFLKLVSQVDSFEQLEPLPDIDFNIRAGQCPRRLRQPRTCQALDRGGRADAARRPRRARPHHRGSRRDAGLRRPTPRTPPCRRPRRCRDPGRERGAAHPARCAWQRARPLSGPGVRHRRRRWGRLRGMAVNA